MRPARPSPSPTPSSNAWCRERASGRGTTWVNWWFDGFPIIVLRREAHTLVNGHAPDDRAALAKVRASMGNLIDDRDSPTWAYDMALRARASQHAIPECSGSAADRARPNRRSRAAACCDGRREDQSTASVDRSRYVACSGRPARSRGGRFCTCTQVDPTEPSGFQSARSAMCRASQGAGGF